MDMSLTKPVSAAQPCGPDPEYDPEYLLLFSRAAPRRRRNMVILSVRRKP